MVADTVSHALNCFAPPGIAALVVSTSILAACSPGESPAFQAYKAFVSATIRGDCDAMYGLAEKDAIAFVDSQCKRRSMNIMGQAVDLGSVASNVASIRPASTPFNDPISMERTIESETRSPDRNTVDLVVFEKSFQRKGSVRELTGQRRHTVTLEFRSGLWRLTRFNEEMLR